MTFKLAVKGIIRRDDGRILIVKRSDGDDHAPGVWETVGGGIDEQAEPQEALKREIMEEVGLGVEIGEPFNVFSFVRDSGEFKIGITFLCKYIGGEVKLSHEHSAFEWIEPKDFKDFKSLPSLHEEIERYAKRCC